MQNRKTHTPGWKVKQAESLRRVHTAESGTGAASEAYLPDGGPSELGEREVGAFSVGRPCSRQQSGGQVVGTAACRHGYRGTAGAGASNVEREGPLTRSPDTDPSRAKLPPASVQ